MVGAGGPRMKGGQGQLASQRTHLLTARHTDANRMKQASGDREGKKKKGKPRASSPRDSIPHHPRRGKDRRGIRGGRARRGALRTAGRPARRRGEEGRVSPNGGDQANAGSGACRGPGPSEKKEAGAGSYRGRRQGGGIGGWPGSPMHPSQATRSPEWRRGEPGNEATTDGTPKGEPSSS